MLARPMRFFGFITSTVWRLTGCRRSHGTQARQLLERLLIDADFPAFTPGPGAFVAVDRLARPECQRFVLEPGGGTTRRTGTVLSNNSATTTQAGPIRSPIIPEFACSRAEAGWRCPLVLRLNQRC